MFGVRVWFVCMVCMCGLYMWFVCVACMCDVLNSVVCVAQYGVLSCIFYCVISMCYLYPKVYFTDVSAVVSFLFHNDSLCLIPFRHI